MNRIIQLNFIFFTTLTLLIGCNPNKTLPIQNKSNKSTSATQENYPPVLPSSNPASQSKAGESAQLKDAQKNINDPVTKEQLEFGSSAGRTQSKNNPPHAPGYKSPQTGAIATPKTSF